MTTPPTLRIGTHALGHGHPCYVIAEAGSNHDGHFDQALRLVDVAVAAGADAVKFQVFQAAQLYAPTAGTSDYLGDPTPIYDIIAKMQMPADWLPKLHAYCGERGIDFLCSAFDEASVDLVDPYVPAWKCASYEMTHTPLLRHMAGKGKPLIVSTGTADLDEVGAMVAVLREVCGPEPPAVLLQCTASYPTPPAGAHVAVVQTLREAFGLWSGLSDHTRDPVAAPAAAVALGAVVVEKHFTLDNRLPGPDHKFALEPGELAAMVRAVRAAQVALGSGRKQPDAVEAELRLFARRSVFTTRPVAAGEVLSRDNTRVLRRGKQQAGLDPVHHAAILGQPAVRDLPAWHALQPDDVADGAARVVEALQLRRATADDAERVWQWNNEPAVRAVSLQTAAIPWDGHVRWFARQLDDPHTRLWIVQRQGQPVGVVRIDGAARLSLALDPSVRGQGLGRAVLRLACATLRGETGRAHVDAEIVADNLQSQKAFAAAGFVQVGQREAGGRTVQLWVWRAE